MKMGEVGKGEKKGGYSKREDRTRGGESGGCNN
jgi:hypothetical protein